MKIIDDLKGALTAMFTKNADKYSEYVSKLAMVPQTDSEVLFDDVESLTRDENLVLYNTMDDESPECSTALDFYADLATQGDDVLMRGHKVIVETKSNEARYKLKVKNDKENERIQKIISAFEKRTKIKYILSDIVRNALKTGDDFNEVTFGTLKTTGAKVIASLLPLDVTKVSINKDKYNRLIEEEPYWYVADKTNPTDVIKYKDEEIFRIQNGGRSHIFGKSLLHNGRKSFLRLDAIESGTVVGRLVRSQQRYAFKVDTTGMSAKSGLDYIKDYKKIFYKKRITDDKGNIKWIKAPLAIDDDLFIPCKKDGVADVKVLESSAYLSQIDDIIYFRDKLITSLKITKATTGTTEGSKNATAEMDTNPIRVVKGLQNNIRFALEKLYATELRLNCVSDDVIETMEIEMPEISSVAEFRKWSIERLRAEIAKIYKESGIMATKNILENVLYLEESAISTILADLEVEQQKEFEKQKELAKMGKSNQQGSGYPASRKTTLKTNFKNKKTGKGANALTQPNQSESEQPDDEEQINEDQE